MPIPFDFSYRESQFLAAHFQSEGITLHAYPDVELDLPVFSEHELRFMTLQEQREEAERIRAEEEGEFSFVHCRCFTSSDSYVSFSP